MKFTVNVEDTETIDNFFRAYAETGTPSAGLSRLINAYSAYNASREVCGAHDNEISTTAAIIDAMVALRDTIRTMELRYLDTPEVK